MAATGQFGRRQIPVSQSPAPRAVVARHAPRAESGDLSMPGCALPARLTEVRPVVLREAMLEDRATDEQDLASWTSGRRERRRMPWRAISLMASLCFGIGSLVLPESVNQSANVVLYALMAASLYAGVRKRVDAK
jgi:hypothetical protein